MSGLMQAGLCSIKKRLASTCWLFRNPNIVQQQCSKMTVMEKLFIAPRIIYQPRDDIARFFDSSIDAEPGKNFSDRLRWSNPVISKLKSVSLISVCRILASKQKNRLFHVFWSKKLMYCFHHHQITPWKILQRWKFTWEFPGPFGSGGPNHHHFTIFRWQTP